MADRLEEAASRLASRLKAHAGRAVVYERGPYRIELTATLGRKAYQVDAGYGASVWVASMDFIVAAADLVLYGLAVAPETGDRIRVARAGGGTDVYEVLAPGREMSVSEPLDPHGTMLRIHTKHVTTE